MCRIIGKIGLKKEPIEYEMLKAPHSLLYMSQKGRQPEGGRGTHGDGWGIAYRKDREIQIRKSGRPAYEDKNFRESASNVITDLFIGSVRLASPGIPVTKENAHPFQVGDLALVHNGTIKKGLPRYGESDTLDFLRWISKNWNRENEDLIKLLKKTSDSWTYTSLSFLMMNGEKLYVFRQTMEDPKKLSYYTLYTFRSEESFLIASEPLDDKDWGLLTNGTLLIIQSPEKWEKMSIR